MPVDLPRTKPAATPRRRWTFGRIVATAFLLWIAKSGLALARACMWLVNKLDA